MNNSIEFFFELKKTNKKIIQLIEEEINLYNETMGFISDTCEYNYITMDFINYYNNLSEKCVAKLDQIKEITKELDNDIYKLCEHNFVTDTIDIDPEKTKTICYCTICEYTKE